MTDNEMTPQAKRFFREHPNIKEIVFDPDMTPADRHRKLAHYEHILYIGEHHDHRHISPGIRKPDGTKAVRTMEQIKRDRNRKLNNEQTYAIAAE